MALFRFRIRSSERDRDTDEGRRERLAQLLETLRTEIDRERDGLRERYDKVTADAAFSQQALEDERAADAISSRIDELTVAMQRFSDRLSSLDRQAAFLAEMSDSVNAFFREDTAPGTASTESGLSPN